MTPVVVLNTKPAGSPGVIDQVVTVPVTVGAQATMAVSFLNSTESGAKARLVGAGIRTVTVRTAEALPVLFIAVTVMGVAPTAIVGVPSKAQVVEFTITPGMAGEIEHEVIKPVVVGVCVAVTPTVSTTAAGVKTIVGFAINTVTFRVADTEPVLFVAVTV